jgi:hypothetical protein
VDLIVPLLFWTLPVLLFANLLKAFFYFSRQNKMVAKAANELQIVGALVD